MSLYAIASLDAARGIGCGGELLVRIPEDLRRFRALTIGKTVVMGYNTLMSLPGSRPLPERRNIVLTRRTAVIDGAETADSIEALMALLKAGGDAFVIGGQSVYEQLLPYCDGAYLTHIDSGFPRADRFFPPLPEDWQLLEESEAKEHGQLRYKYAEYRRRS